MIEKHYKSDFKVFVTFPNASVPFKFTYFIEGNRTKYVVSYDGYSYYNCSPMEDGRICVMFQNHNLGIGSVSVIRQYFIPDEDFASGVCRTFSEESTDIYLGETFSDEGDIHVELPPNYIQGKSGKSAYEIWLEQGNEGSEQDFLDSLKGDKGDKGDKMTYDDLSEEEKDDLASRVPTPDADLSNYAKKSEVPKKTSQLTNDSGFVTSVDVATAIQSAIINELNSEV